MILIHFKGMDFGFISLKKKTSEAQVLDHSPLCLKNWLMENRMGVKVHYEAMMKYKLTKNNHLYLKGRFYATQLMYLRKQFASR